MKQINTYITEKLKLNRDSGRKYNYHPTSKEQLQRIVRNLLHERGKDADLNDIDVSEIDDMSGLFNHIMDPHNIDISEWDVSNVKDMWMMFFKCKNFNCDLSQWDVSNVQSFGDMFLGCDSLKKIPEWYKDK